MCIFVRMVYQAHVKEEMEARRNNVIPHLLFCLIY